MKKQYHNRLLPLILAAVLLHGCAAPDSRNSAADTSGPETNAPASQEAGRTLSSEPKELSQLILFEGQDIEGNPVSSSIFSEARLTMVNVWATYCNPCLREMPGLGELADAYDPEDFQLIGIISDVPEGSDAETLKLAADLIERTGASYPHLLLNQSLYNALLTNVSAVPTTFFINEKGTIIDTVIGSMDKSAWEEKINALLEEP